MELCQRPRTVSEVQEIDIRSSSLFHWCSNSLVKGHQISQARFALREAMLADCSNLPVFHMP